MDSQLKAKSGRPFKSERAAKSALTKLRKTLDPCPYQPSQVDGGWALVLSAPLEHTEPQRKNPCVFYFSGVSSRKEAELLKAAGVRHVLADPDDIANAAGFELALDSGAYRAFKNKQELDKPRLYALAKEKTLDFVVAPDVINNGIQSRDNWNEMLWPENRPGNTPVVPTWHWGESEELLEHYLARADIVGIGGLVPTFRKAKYGKPWEKKRARALLAELVELCQRYPGRFHVFGANWEEAITALAPYARSMDSSLWLAGRRYGKVIRCTQTGKLLRRSPGPDDESSPDELCVQSAQAILTYFEKVSMGNLESAKPPKRPQREAFRPPIAVPVILADLEDIKTRLPVLTPEQATDVEAAEKRFFKDNGKGILFTNATGTGKTFTGLGIIKRFWLQGRPDILIVTPSSTKCADWVEDGDKLGLRILTLVDTQDAGQGICTTTYANFKDNQALHMREWDLLVYDESHKLNSNESGRETQAQYRHRHLANTKKWTARTNAERNLSHSVEQRNTLRDELRELHQRQHDRLYGLLPKDETAAQQDRVREAELQEQVKRIDQALEAEEKRLANKTKVVFLSATPFAYHYCLDYGDETLFDIYKDHSDVGFYTSNFGYKVRYSKLNKPDAEVNVGMLERAFHDRLREEGVIVARGLELPVDYSREFIQMEESPIFQHLDHGISIVQGYADRDNNFKYLPRLYHDQFNWVYMHQLLEGIKAQQVVERIKQHQALGRKVVIFHTYKKGAFKHPFHFNYISSKFDSDEKAALRGEIHKFQSRYPELVNLKIGYGSPVDILPGKIPNLLLFNGDVPKKERRKAVKLFNTDGSGYDVILVQSDAGKEGISLHDKTGKHPRVVMHLDLPIKPTDATQKEGRAYRWGTVSNAINEYIVMGTDFEKRLFGECINSRVGTVENLAMGSQARDLDEAFKNGILNAWYFDPHEAQGVGGKESDGKQVVMSEWDKALTHYYTSANLKGKKRWQRQGNDYFATPEPIGLKMVEWLEPEPGQDWLEPSAGHGAIARFFPEDTNNVFVEPSVELASELKVLGHGKVRMEPFEALHPVNKFDRIAMNPPFGQAGATALKHLDKAFSHLRDGGRLACIFPWRGAAMNKFELWLEETEGAYLYGTVDLPACTFERAGTSIITRILMIEKHSKPDDAPGYLHTATLIAENNKELFDRLEGIDL